MTEPPPTSSPPPGPSGPPPGPPTFLWPNPESYIYQVLFSVVVIAIIVLNLTVIILYCRMARLLQRKIPNMLLLNQGLVDLLSSGHCYHSTEPYCHHPVPSNGTFTAEKDT